MKSTCLPASRFLRSLLALAAGMALFAPLSRLKAAPPADFTVEAPATGQHFKLSEARGKYVALHFLLQTECPYCLKHTRDYAVKSKDVTDVVHVFLKPDDSEAIKKWSDAANRGDDFADLSIFRDPEAKLADQYGIPGGFKFHGQTVHYPALVLLNPAGREVFRYLGRDNTDRYSYEQFTAKLAELKSKPSVGLPHYNLGPDHLALSGYDPVGYLTENKALKGQKTISTSHRGVTYYFASEDHRKAFLQAPDRYLPTYGGWCATAMAKGEKVEIDPTNFKVTNGRLFLFFKAFYANAIKDWNRDEANQTQRADAHWKEISGE